MATTQKNLLNKLLRGTTKDLTKYTQPKIAAGGVGEVNLSEVATTDNTANARRLTSGLNTLSESIQNLGTFHRAKQLNNDVIRAKAAVAYENVMPGGLLPEAQRAYLELTAQRDTRKFFDTLENEQNERAKLLLSNENYTPVQQIQQHEAFVRESFQNFATNAQFTTGQYISTVPIVEKETERFQNEFIKVQSNLLASERITDINQSIASIVTGVIKDNDNSDDPKELNDIFDDKFHIKLRDEIKDAFPTASKTDLDLRIIDVLGQIAADPENPQPEIIEYLDNPRSNKSLPRFTLIDIVGKSANAALDKAMSVFNRAESERKEKETEEKKGKERQAFQLAGKYVVKSLQNKALTRTKDIFLQELVGNSELQHLTKTDAKYFAELYESGVTNRSKLFDPVKVARITTQIGKQDWGSRSELQASIKDLHINDQLSILNSWDKWETKELEDYEKEAIDYGTALGKDHIRKQKTLLREEAIKQLLSNSKEQYTVSDFYGTADPDARAELEVLMSHLEFDDIRFRNLEQQGENLEARFHTRVREILQEINTKDEPAKAAEAIRKLRDVFLAGDASQLLSDKARADRKEMERIGAGGVIKGEELGKTMGKGPSAVAGVGIEPMKIIDTGGAGVKQSSSDIATRSNLPLPRIPTKFSIPKIEPSSILRDSIETLSHFGVKVPETVPKTIEDVSTTVDKHIEVIQKDIVVPATKIAKDILKSGPKVREKVKGEASDISDRFMDTVEGKQQFNSLEEASKYIVTGDKDFSFKELGQDIVDEVKDLDDKIIRALASTGPATEEDIRNMFTEDISNIKEGMKKLAREQYERGGGEVFKKLGEISDKETPDKTGVGEPSPIKPGKAQTKVTDNLTSFMDYKGVTGISGNQMSNWIKKNWREFNKWGGSEAEGATRSQVTKTKIKTGSQVVDNFNLDTGKLFWSERYNASKVKEKKAGRIKYKQGIKNYQNNQLSKEQQYNVNNMLAVFTKSKPHWIDDLKKTDMSVENFKELMIGTYSAETDFGRDKDFLKTGKSPTGVVGELQVTAKTFQDVIQEKGIFGPNIIGYLNKHSTDNKNKYNLNKLRKMKPSGLRKIMSDDPIFSWLAGITVMILKLQTATGSD